VSLILANTGSYPRVGDSPELQILRRTLAAMDRGERNSADLADAENEMTRRALEDQAQAGIDLFTDGQIRWHDPISHIPSKLEGVKINGLLRYFDTNFYFRQPVLLARPRRTAPLLVNEFLFARNALGQLPTAHDRAGRLSIKVVLTGPYTLARFSLAEDPGMRSLENRLEAYAEVIGDELVSLAEVGAEFLQVDEPAILAHPEDWDLFQAAILTLVRRKRETTRGSRRPTLALFFYFSDPQPLYSRLAQLPVDVLGLDFTYNPQFYDAVAAEGAPIPLGLGLLDGRNTKLEHAADLARKIEKILPRIGGARAFLGPSCGLEFLPRDRAFAKLQLMSQVRKALHG
jgi:5-methyltetrahydropteroyltriglutamate--homocysteine methyltransferase